MTSLANHSLFIAARSIEAIYWECNTRQIELGQSEYELPPRLEEVGSLVANGRIASAVSAYGRELVDLEKSAQVFLAKAAIRCGDIDANDPGRAAFLPIVSSSDECFLIPPWVLSRALDEINEGPSEE